MAVKSLFLQGLTACGILRGQVYYCWREGSKVISVNALLSLPYCASAEEVSKFYRDLNEVIKAVSLIHSDLFQTWKVSLDRGVLLAFYAPSAEKYMTDAIFEFKRGSIEITPIKTVAGLIICGRKTVNVDDASSENWQDALINQGHSVDLINGISEQLATYLEETKKLALLI